MGCFAAHLLMTNKSLDGHYLFSIGIGCLLLLFVGELYGSINGFSPYSRILYGLTFTLIVTGLCILERTKPYKLPSLLKVLGTSSYSIYLSHLFFIGIYYKVFLIVGLIDSLPISFSAAFVLMLTLISSIVLSKLVEFPLMAFIRQRIM